MLEDWAMDLTPKTNEAWEARHWEVQDLFSPAAPINEASLIAGRQEQIHDLTGAVFERGRHAILFGEKGVGKTSLANTFHMMFSSGMRSIVSIRKPAFPGDNFSSLWRRVFSEMMVDGQRVSALYPGQITPDDVVRELAGFGLNTLPIIILDEFDKFSDVESKKLISHTIKAVSDDKTCNATIVIVGIAEDVAILVEEHSSISRNITEIKMPRMSRPEMDEIIDQRYPKVGLSLETEARSNILNLARGLPEYVHFLARDAAKSAIQARRLDVNAGDVGVAIRNMMKNADQTSEDAYNTAILSNKKNNLYKQVLLSCALARTDDMGRFTPSDVLPPLTRILGRQIKIANFFPHIEAFCTEERGAILEKKGARQAYKYRFREPKMQPYVLMKGVATNLVPPDVVLTL
jgi:hypothetical protein